MGNQELIDNFKGYAVVRAKHAYGPMGHRGFSVVIFESSAVGYVEAERLHRQFLGQGTGRSAWESNRRVLFHPGGLRQLYGFLARKDDLEEFNKHSQGLISICFNMTFILVIFMSQQYVKAYAKFLGHNITSPFFLLLLPSKFLWNNLFSTLL